MQELDPEEAGYEITGAPGEMNLLASFEYLNQFSFQGFHSYFNRYIIQFSTKLD